MLRRDRGLTEAIFLVGLLLLPLDGYLWRAGLPALVIACALAYGIAWEIPRLLFPRRVGAADQLTASLALTCVLLCFYIGKSDRAIAQMVREQGQAAAFTSPLWIVNDGVLLALTVAVMMVLLAFTTLLLYLWQGDRDHRASFAARLREFLVRDVGCALVGIVVGLGGGAWAVLVSTQGTGIGIATWIAMWAAVRSAALTPTPWQRAVIAVGAALILAGAIGGLTSSWTNALMSALFGAAIAVAHWVVVFALRAVAGTSQEHDPATIEHRHQRPKDAPFYVPWVGFYTLRFVGLVVAFFVVGAGWLWGLR
ncbi:hypothetical protein HRbin17_00933 [bacterium HR17]|uniref:Uncharacterized protein n=1 Tax=Candidatus Fervidibacter japonicus TaxID=2035412 RepID=A0A2H5XB52_9BACT|nr:hypothetical protein HRbin17_00933 [bacterium HR17]